MEEKYWLDRWVREDIGFHQHEINPYLRQYWQVLNLSHASEVFVPLCGKSRDMLWLREQGYSVLGIELSMMAAQSFFEENDLQVCHQIYERFDCLEGDRIKILCGDIFAINRSDLVNIGAVYDRAALVALPPELRRKYVAHLLDVLPLGSKILLIGFDYPQSEMVGPPFAVSPDEVVSLYGRQATVCLLTQINALEQNPSFRDRGLSCLQESVYLITKDKVSIA